MGEMEQVAATVFRILDRAWQQSSSDLSNQDLVDFAENADPILAGMAGRELANRQRPGQNDESGQDGRSSDRHGGESANGWDARPYRTHISFRIFGPEGQMLVRIRHREKIMRARYPADALNKMIGWAESVTRWEFGASATIQLLHFRPPEQVPEPKPSPDSAQLLLFQPAKSKRKKKP